MGRRSVSLSVLRFGGVQGEGANARCLSGCHRRRCSSKKRRHTCWGYQRGSYRGKSCSPTRSQKRNFVNLRTSNSSLCRRCKMCNRRAAARVSKQWSHQSPPASAPARPCPPAPSPQQRAVAAQPLWQAKKKKTPQTSQQPSVHGCGVASCKTEKV